MHGAGWGRWEVAELEGSFNFIGNLNKALEMLSSFHTSLPTEEIILSTIGRDQ